MSLTAILNRPPVSADGLSTEDLKQGEVAYFRSPFLHTRVPKGSEQCLATKCLIPGRDGAIRVQL